MSEGIKGKPILVVAVEDDRDYHDVFWAVHKALEEHRGDKGRRITGQHEYFGVYMLTARTTDEKR